MVAEGWAFPLREQRISYHSGVDYIFSTLEKQMQDSKNAKPLNCYFECGNSYQAVSFAIILIASVRLLSEWMHFRDFKCI